MLAQVYLYHRAGDLVFSRDRGILSRLVRAGQRWRERQPAPYSHVAICLSPGLFLHSMPRVGVSVAYLEDRRAGVIPFRKKEDAVSVLRLPQLDGKETFVLNAILYWTGQDYNYDYFTESSRAGRAYCSQLILQILDKCDIDLPVLENRKRPSPSGLHRALLGSGAVDVTASYRTYSDRLAESDAERTLLANNFQREALRRAVDTNLNAAEFRASINIGLDNVNRMVEEQIKDGFTDRHEIIHGPEEGFVRLCADIVQTTNNSLAVFRMEDMISKLPGHVEDHWLDTSKSTKASVNATGALLYCGTLRNFAKRIDHYREEVSDVDRMLATLALTSSGGREQVGNFLDLCEASLGKFDLEVIGSVTATVDRIGPDMNTIAGDHELLTELAEGLTACAEKWETFRAAVVRAKVRFDENRQQFEEGRDGCEGK